MDNELGTFQKMSAILALTKLIASGNMEFWGDFWGTSMEVTLISNLPIIISMISLWSIGIVIRVAAV